MKNVLRKTTCLFTSFNRNHRFPPILRILSLTDILCPTVSTVALCAALCLLVAVQTDAVPVRHKRDRTPCRQMEINSQLAIRFRGCVTRLRDSIPVDPDDQDLPTLFPSLSQTFNQRDNLTDEGRLVWVENQLLMFRELLASSRAEGGWDPELMRKLQRVIDYTRKIILAVRVAATMLGITLEHSNSTPPSPIPTADPGMDTDVRHYLLIRDFERVVIDVHHQLNRLVRSTCDIP
ncbi:uncharacterized protein LOC144865091 isoform X1 [Branchiostoma floridae x Branchiostoma japonicum]